MKHHVAEAVLAAYPGKKLTRASAREIVIAWAGANGWHQDRWDNWHPREGLRVKLTKQRVQRQKKRGGRWSNASSTPIIDAAMNLVRKAAEVLGDEEVLARIEQRQQSRRGQKEKRAERAKQELLQKEVMDMVAKVASAEMPMGFVTLHDTGRASPEFQARYNDLVRRIQTLRRLGSPPRDQDMFSTFEPPLAPLLVEGLSAQWVEEVRGVPYTVSVRNAGKDTAVIEIGSSAGEYSLGTRVDPVSGWMSSEPGFDRVGDAYVSGRLQRGKDGPYGALYFIISLNKQQGAGSRVLDLWCNLMDSYGVPAWVAEAVGDEGMAFLEAKVRSGRLEMIGGRDKNYVMRCLGGPEGKQPMLPGVPLKPNPTPRGQYEWRTDDALQKWREAMAEEGRQIELPPADEPNPLYWFWQRYHKPRSWGNSWSSWSKPPRSDMSPYFARKYAVRAYAWAVPSPEVIRQIAKKGPLLEVGAGRGYWAKMLADAGADIIATDPYAPDRTFYPVERLADREAVERYGHERTLLLVWPPYDMPVAYDALRAFESVGGKSLVYVGEGYGGCTADDAFHLASGESGWSFDEDDEGPTVENYGWSTVEIDYDLPNWDGIRDSVWFKERGAAVSRNPADIFDFPARPDRVTIGSRTYALSDVGVPIVTTEMEGPFEAVEPMDDDRIIDMGGETFRYVWVHEPKADRLEMYRFRDGEWKVLGSPAEYPQTFKELQRTGQLNTVTADELVEFEGIMRDKSAATLRSLDEWWEAEKSDEQRRVDQLVAMFFDQRVRPEVERAWAEIDRGVYPFDFVYNERIGDHEDRPDQARMHALHKALERTGFKDRAGSPLEEYVLRGLGYGSYDDLEDLQAIQWAVGDHLRHRVYPTVKRGKRRRGFEPAR